jgi:hypothetical protein
MNQFGCPAVYLDQLYSDFRFFVPLFFALIYILTFLWNLGYIVEERANKTKVNINNKLIFFSCIMTHLL